MWNASDFSNFLNDNYLFDYLLLFLGLRGRITQRKTTKKNIKGFIQRRTISKRKLQPEQQRQPRRLVRDVYQRVYERDLSPDSRNIEPYISDSDEEQNNNTLMNIQLNVRMKTSNMQGFASWLYTFFIGSILGTQPVYTLYYIVTSVDENHNFYWASLFFNLIPFVQYVLSVDYFMRSHFEDFYISKFVNYKFPGMNTFVCLVVVLNFIISLFNQLVLSGILSTESNDSEFPGFESYRNSITINIYLIVLWVYARSIIYINLTVFCLVFYKHCKILSNYVRKLKNNTFDNILTINNITQEVLGIRYEMEESIDLLKNIFSSFTLLGAIGFGFFIERLKNGNFQFFPWNQFIIYVIIQIIFIVIIFRVAINKQKLSDYIRQPAFIDKFLKRYNPAEVKDKFKDNIEIVILNIEEENSSTLDWIVLNDIFNEDWTEFKVMGIDISNGELIKKGFVIVGLIVGLNSFINN